MKKYFIIHDYSENMKARFASYNLKGKADIWWEELKNVRAITEEELTQEEFEKLFREKYLSEHYYDNKAKAFYELKMGKLTNDNYVTKFFELLRYVPYLKDEKSKINIFINMLPMEFRDKIELLKPQTLKDDIKKVEHCYEQEKRRPGIKNNWQAKINVGCNKNWTKKKLDKKEVKHPDQTRQFQQRPNVVVYKNVQQPTST